MSASATDLLKKYKSLFSTTLSTGIGTGTGDTLTPATVTGLPTDTGITITIDRVDSSGTATPTKLERITGVIAGGNLTSYTRAIDSTTEQAHSAGAVIEMVFNADDWNDMCDWGLAEHNQDGTHSDITASTISASTVSASGVTSTNFVNASTVSASDIAATRNLTLANVTPTTDGVVGFDRTNEDLVVGDGSNSQIVHMGTWKTWSPTPTNITVGNGTVIAKYMQVGKTIHFYYRLVLGSTSSIGTSPTISLPANTTTGTSGKIGSCDCEDNNGSTYAAQTAVVSTSTVKGQVMVSSGTYTTFSNITATIPFTWATDDHYILRGTYQVD